MRITMKEPTHNSRRASFSTLTNNNSNNPTDYHFGMRGAVHSAHEPVGGSFLSNLVKISGVNMPWSSRS